MWQEFLELIVHITNFFLGIACWVTMCGIGYFLFNKKWKEMKEDYFFSLLMGAGMIGIILMFLHANHKPTMLDLHGDYLECKKCHKTIEKIACPNCGEKYSAIPIYELPWEYDTSSSD